MKNVSYLLILVLAACAKPNSTIVAWNTAMGKLAVQKVAVPINAAGLKAKYRGVAFEQVYNPQSFYSTYGGQSNAAQLYAQGYTQNINNPAQTCNDLDAANKAATITTTEDLSNRILAMASCLYTMYSYSPGNVAASQFMNPYAASAYSYGSLGSAFGGTPMPFQTYYNGTSSILTGNQYNSSMYSPVYGSQMANTTFPFAASGLNYY